MTSGSQNENYLDIPVPAEKPFQVTVDIPGVIEKLVLAKEAPQIFRLERAAFVKDKISSENGKFG